MGSPIFQLPNDLIMAILSRLPIKTLIICRYVCKSWLYTILSYRFAHIHLHSASQRNTHITSFIFTHNFDLCLLEHQHNFCNLDAVTVLNTPFKKLKIKCRLVGSCNGLLCLSESRRNDPVYVCNPVIGDYMTLPPIYEASDHPIVSGFGFDSKTGEYKVVRMLFHRIDLSTSSFELVGQIYTIGSGEWRSIGDVPYPINAKMSSVFVNGVMHWLTDNSLSVEFSELIVCLDASTELFRVMQAPPAYNHTDSRNNLLRLAVLGECLCLVDDKSYDCVVVWMMKEYGVAKSWTKQLIVKRLEYQVRPDRFSLRPFGSIQNKKVLFLCYEEMLKSYDVVMGVFRSVYVRGLPTNFDAITHVGSLVMPKNVGQTIRERGKSGYGRWSTTLFPVPSRASF